MVMKMSAKLKTGQKFKSIKSNTHPKTILSIRLDDAPDKIANSAYVSTFDLKLVILTKKSDFFKDFINKINRNKNKTGHRKKKNQPGNSIPQEIPELQT